MYFNIIKHFYLKTKFFDTLNKSEKLIKIQDVIPLNQILFYTMYINFYQNYIY